MRMLLSACAFAELMLPQTISDAAIAALLIKLMNRYLPFSLVMVLDCLFTCQLERFVDQRTVDVLRHRRNLLALINAFLGAQLHGLVVGGLAHAAVFWKGLKILNQILVVFFG